jgi:hypothetical protein
MASYLVFILNGEEIVEVEELIRRIDLITGSVDLKIFARGGNLVENQAKIEEFESWMERVDPEGILNYP